MRSWSEERPASRPSNGGLPTRSRPEDTSWIGRVLRWFTPHVRDDEESLRRARVILVLYLVAGLVEPFLSARHYVVHHSAGAAAVTLAVAVGAWATLAAMRRGLSPAVAAQIACAAVTLAGPAVCIARGEFLVTPQMANVFLPIAGLVFGRRRMALVWTLLGFVSLTFVALCAMLGLFGVRQEGTGEYPQLLFFLACSTALAFAYDSTRRQLDLERARLEEHLAKTRRLESIGYLAAGVAHDFNNLLTVFAASASSLLEELPEGHAGRADAEAVQEGVARGRTITARLLSSARKDCEAATEAFDLQAVLDKNRTLLARALPASIILEAWATPEKKLVFGDAAELGQVLLNLVVNARDAMPAGGRIRITTRSERAIGRDSQVTWFWVVSVRDTGTGIPAEVLPHLFEPFFTTKPRGAGTGLGLSSAYGAIKAMGGDIRVASSAGAGACFDVYLKRASDAADVLEAPASTGRPVPSEVVASGPPSSLPVLSEPDAPTDAPTVTGQRLVSGSSVPASPRARRGSDVEGRAAPTTSRARDVPRVMHDDEPAPEPSSELPPAFAPTHTPPPVNRPRGTIVLVDDQAPVLRATKRLLMREGYTVLEANNGHAALAYVESGGPVDLLLTDVMMPEMNGVQLAAAFRAKRPGLPIVYVSGHFDDPGVRRDIDEGTARLLEKPFTSAELVATVATAIGRRSGIVERAVIETGAGARDEGKR